MAKVWTARYGRTDMRAPYMCSVRAAMFDLHLNVHFCTFCVMKAATGSKPQGKVEEYSIVPCRVLVGTELYRKEAIRASETDNVECREPNNYSRLHKQTAVDGDARSRQQMISMTTSPRQWLLRNPRSVLVTVASSVNVHRRDDVGSFSYFFERQSIYIDFAGGLENMSPLITVNGTKFSKVRKSLTFSNAHEPSVNSTKTAPCNFRPPAMRSLCIIWHLQLRRLDFAPPRTSAWWTVAFCHLRFFSYFVHPCQCSIPRPMIPTILAQLIPRPSLLTYS